MGETSRVETSNISQFSNKFLLVAWTGKYQALAAVGGLDEADRSVRE